MLDEEKLSGKLDILLAWMKALQAGEYEMTRRGADTFVAVLDQCRQEAALLESIEQTVLMELSDAASHRVAAARVAIAEGLALLAEAPTNVVILPVVRYCREPGGDAA